MTVISSVQCPKDHPSIALKNRRPVEKCFQKICVRVKIALELLFENSSKMSMSKREMETSFNKITTFE